VKNNAKKETGKKYLYMKKAGFRGLDSGEWLLSITLSQKMKKSHLDPCGRVSCTKPLIREKTSASLPQMSGT
jgi:hypothetical protein